MKVNEVREYMLQRFRKELSDKLSYHSIIHIIDVLQSSGRLAEAEGLNDYEKDLLATAVLFHDAGFLYQMNRHEEKSCEIARDVLKDYGYSQLEIEKICGMIMATRIPQTPYNKLEEIICDADLDYLGRDDFWSTGNKLFEELRFFGIVGDVNEWNTLQVSFLEKHHYFTETAKRERERLKNTHLDEVKRKINQ